MLLDKKELDENELDKSVLDEMLLSPLGYSRPLFLIKYFFKDYGF